MAFGEVDQNCQNSERVLVKTDPKRQETESMPSAAKLYQLFRDRNKVKHGFAVDKTTEEEQIDTSSVNAQAN
jgi:hypothetical protein